MDALLKAISIISKRRYEDDPVDRLNYRTTTTVFVSASLIISYKSYFGTALICWTPMQFRSGWDQFANDYCYIENTYYAPLDNASIPAESERDRTELPYYQWVPWILALQAMMFCFPHMFWRMLNWMSGVQVRAIVTMATISTSCATKAQMDEVLEMVANHLRAGLKMSRGHFHLKTSSNPLGFWGKSVATRTRCYITFCYFAMKALSIVNLIIQLAILDLFLDIPAGKSLTWGWTLLGHLMRGDEWSCTKYFPRVTMCDFQIRELGNLHRWSIQCVLPLNMFNEKVYVALWFWIYFVFFLTLFNTVQWLIKILHNGSRLRFINKILDVAKSVDSSAYQESGQQAEEICRNLGWDGVLILRLIASNAGKYACVGILNHLYGKGVLANGT